ncbi:MAG: hydrogenase assembly protein HupF [Acidimicrobiales bacterium]
MELIDLAEGLGPLADDLATTSLALARRFAAGATMWCVAPEWPPHAQHVAVEFVHPVIMGKRALPAAIVEGSDLIGGLRALSRPGDILCAVATGVEPNVVSAMRRASAWGLTTVWVGAGARPEPGAADHVLWLPGEVAAAAHGGRFVLMYHLLWELTHVCFEHPGLLEAEPECDDEVCVTCSDEGRVAEVVVGGAPGYVQVRTARGLESVDTTLIGDAHPGDLVLVHAGAAITMLEGSSR